MYIKTLKKVTGIPAGAALTLAGVNPAGAAQVTLVLSALDEFGTSDVVTRLVLSVSEAVSLGQRLLATVRDAQDQANHDETVKANIRRAETDALASRLDPPTDY